MGSAIKKVAPIAAIAVGAFAGYAIFGGALGAIRGASLGFRLAGALSGGGSGDSSGGGSAGSVGSSSIPDTGQLATAIGEDAWIPKQYGSRRAGMVLIASDVMNAQHVIQTGQKASGAFATSVYALGEGPWNKITQLKYGGVDIFKSGETIDFTTDGSDNIYSFGNAIYRDDNVDFSNLEIQFVRGTIGQPLSEMLSRVTGAVADSDGNTRWFRDTDIGNGICYMVLRIRREKESLIRTTAPTNLTIEAEGKQIPEIRLDGSPIQYFSIVDGIDYNTGRNPALIALDQLRTSVFGLGLTDSEIDFDSFVNFANYCDAPGTYSDGTTVQPFRLDGQFGQGDTTRQILEEISLCTGALFADENGVVTVKIDKQEIGTTTVAINQDNLVNSVTRIEPKTSELPNVINVKYLDDRGFESIDVVEFDKATQNAEGRKEADLQLRMVSTSQHAIELGKRYLYQTRQPTFQFRMNTAGYDLDVYGVSSFADILDTNIVATGAKVRIFNTTKERILENEGQSPVQVVAKLYSDQIYIINPDSMSIVPTVKDSDAPDLLAIPAPLGATLTRNGATQATLDWDNITQYYTEIQFRKTTDTIFTDYGVVQQSPAEITFPVADSYVVRLRYLIPQADIGPGPFTQVGPFSSTSASGDLTIAQGVEKSSGTGENLPSQPVRTTVSDTGAVTQVRYAETEDGSVGFRKDHLSAQEVQNVTHSDETTEPNKIIATGTRTSHEIDITIPSDYDSGAASNQTQVFTASGTRSNVVAPAVNEQIDISLTDGFVFDDVFGNGKRLEIIPTGPALPNQGQNSLRVGVTYDGANFWQITTAGHLRTASTLDGLGTASNIILANDDSAKFTGMGAVNTTSGLIRLTDSGTSKRLAFVVGSNPPNGNSDTWTILTIASDGTRTYSAIVDAGTNSTSRAKSTASNDIGSGATQIMTANRYSLDGGLTWSTTSVANNTRVNAITFFDGKFVIATQQSGQVTVYSATNANNTFTLRSTTSNNSGANFFIVNRGGTPRLNLIKRNSNNGDTADNNLTTTDGNTWTNIVINSGTGVTNATGPGGLGSYFYNTRFYIVFLVTQSQNYQIVESTDGVNYTTLSDAGNLAGVVAYETFLNSTVRYWGSNNFSSSNYNDQQLIQEVDHDNPSIQIDFNTTNKTVNPAITNLDIPSLTASSTVATLNEVRNNIITNNPTFSVSTPAAKEVDVPFNSFLVGALPEQMDFQVSQNISQDFATFDGSNYWTKGGNFNNTGREVYRSPTFENPTWSPFNAVTQNQIDDNFATTQQIYATNNGNFVLTTSDPNTNTGNTAVANAAHILTVSSNPKSVAPTFQGVKLDNNTAHGGHSQNCGIVEQQSGDGKFLILGNCDANDNGSSPGMPVPTYNQGNDPTRGWSTGFGKNDFTGTGTGGIINGDNNELGMITLGTKTGDLVDTINTYKFVPATGNDQAGEITLIREDLTKEIITLPSGINTAALFKTAIDGATNVTSSTISGNFITVTFTAAAGKAFLQLTQQAKGSGTSGQQFFGTTITIENQSINYNSDLNQALAYSGQGFAIAQVREVPSSISTSGTTTTIQFNSSTRDPRFFTGGPVFRYVVDPLYYQDGYGYTAFKGLTANNNTAVYNYHFENNNNGTVNSALLQTSDKVIDTGLTVDSLVVSTAGTNGGNVNDGIVVNGDQRALFSEYELMVNQSAGVYTEVLGAGVAEGGTEPYTVKSVSSNGSIMVINNPNIVNSNSLSRYNPFRPTDFYTHPTKYASTSQGDLIPVASSDNPLATNGTTGNQLVAGEINMIAVTNFPTTGGDLFYEGTRFSYTGITGTKLTGVTGIDVVSTFNSSGQNITYFTEEITLTAYDDFNFNDAGFSVGGNIFADRIIAMSSEVSYDVLTDKTTLSYPSNTTVGFTGWRVGDKIYRRKLWGVSWDLSLLNEDITADSIFNRSGSNVTAQPDNTFVFSIFEKDAVSNSNIQVFYNGIQDQITNEINWDRRVPSNTAISSPTANSPTTPRVIKKGLTFHIADFTSTDLTNWISAPTELANAGGSQLGSIEYSNTLSNGSVICINKNDSNRLFLASDRFILQTITVNYNISDNFNQQFDQENSAINGSFIFNTTDGSVSNAILSTYTISNPDNTTSTTFTSSVTGDTQTDLNAVLTSLETAVDSKTELPINFTASFIGNDLTLLADTNRSLVTPWTITVNHGSGDGDIAFTAATVTPQVVGKQFNMDAENGIHLLRTINPVLRQGFENNSDADSTADQIATAVKLANPFVTTSKSLVSTNTVLNVNFQTDDDLTIDTKFNFFDSLGMNDTTVSSVSTSGSIGTITTSDGTPITNLTTHKTMVTLTEPDGSNNTGNTILNLGYFNSYTDNTFTTESVIRGNNNKIMDRTSNSLITDMRASLSNGVNSWTLSNNNTSDIATMRSVNKEHFRNLWTWTITPPTVNNGDWSTNLFTLGQGGFGIPTFYGLRSTDIETEDTAFDTYCWFMLTNTLNAGVDITPTYRQTVPFVPIFDFINSTPQIGYRVVPTFDNPTNNDIPQPQFQSDTTTSSEIQNLPINAPDGTPADGSTIVIVGGQFYIANIVNGLAETEDLGTPTFASTGNIVTNFIPDPPPLTTQLGLSKSNSGNTGIVLATDYPTDTVISNSIGGTNQLTITTTSEDTNFFRLNFTPSPGATGWVANDVIFTQGSTTFVPGTTIYNVGATFTLALDNSGNTVDIERRMVYRYSEPQGTPTWTQVS